MASAYGLSSGVDALEQLEAVGRLAYAALLGAVIGFERELRGYPAGVRTVALVTLGAALFTEVSAMTGVEDRIAAGIVTGIGFIGAGVIFHEGAGVRGITTAATIWAAAAIGMAVGRELYLAPALAAALVFLILEARPVVRRVTAVAGRWLPPTQTREVDEEPPGAEDEAT